ncbi:aldehyde dehydrogenase family protein [Caulobacter sp. 17J80-11]|uniref:aldehyde dehydrogenase family protein n=1 Tax=Caulobacter sp. 17J80-11 TaxID=2763502 RepID=UPI00165384D4|nr:aldehyde dehydrogenase family protein [Caulobacter sp. 17J80-11]MBC6983590.1 aldehyde dehydrogenase family protein [Caulobacter sp. 17J80-11]
MAKRYANLIGGEWVDGANAAQNLNPSDLDDVVGEFAQGDAADVDRAVAAAQAALPAWSRATAQVRGDLLDKVADRLLAREAELGELLAREEGKTLAEAKGEVQRAGRIFKFFAGECWRAVGEVLPSQRPGVSVETRREPVGVVGLITPWNFPIAIPAWKAAPALAYGNCVVIKPADIVPASVWALAEIIHEAGAPAGVFNLVMGRGSVVGEALINHKGVDAISFTGSQGVGGRIAEACAKNFKRFQLEMGGKNPLVVLDDADLDLAVEGALNGAFFSTGQRCTASSRLIVTKGVYGEFVRRLKTRLEALKVGDARDPATQMGPVVSDPQLRQNLDYVRVGTEEGATLAFGGERLEMPKRGFYMRPALFTDVDNSMRVAREEIFGPVAVAILADSAEHALEIANDTEFGLSAGVYTTSLKHARMFQDGLKTGMVMVNLPTAGVDLHAPFGGTKASSFGPREQGPYAREFYTRLKTSYVQA